MPSAKHAVRASDVRVGHCIFDQAWWLEALAPGAWGEVLLEDEGGIFARLPYIVRRRLGVVVLTQPPLTPTLGPWLAESSGTYAKRLALEHRRLSQLIDRLPRFDLFQQTFHFSMMNDLPFHWSGFDGTLRYTYRLPDISDQDRIWASIRQETRRHIRRASETLSVHCDLGLARFLELNYNTFERQSMPRPYPSSLVERLDAACTLRDARRMFFAVDKDERLHAAIYVVWDADSAYLLMGGHDPSLRNSGAMDLLVWEAIKSCSGLTRAFDFAGSMIQTVEQFNRSFGARQVPYLFVGKANPKGRAARAAVDATRRVGRAARRARTRSQPVMVHSQAAAFGRRQPSTSSP